MKRKWIKSGTINLLLILTVVLIAIGQNNGNSQNVQNKLVDRFEKLIKNKESRFKGGRNAVDVRPNRDSLGSGWKLHEDYVYADVDDYSSIEEAITVMNNYLTEIRPVRHAKTKLTNLGDEAYLELGKNIASLKLRKGKVVIKVSATNSKIATRFARYFVREIEKRDRGEPRADNVCIYGIKDRYLKDETNFQ